MLAFGKNAFKGKKDENILYTSMHMCGLIVFYKQNFNQIIWNYARWFSFAGNRKGCTIYHLGICPSVWWKGSFKILERNFTVRSCIKIFLLWSRIKNVYWLYRNIAEYFKEHSQGFAFWWTMFKIVHTACTDRQYAVCTPSLVPQMIFIIGSLLYHFASVFWGVIYSLSRMRMQTLERNVFPLMA